MAKRDFDKYFATISAQYSEMLRVLQEYEKECTENLVDSDTVDSMEQAIQPIKSTYMILSYANYLLNLSKNKKTRLRMTRELEKKMMKIDKKAHGDSIIKENNMALEKLRGCMDE